MLVYWPSNHNREAMMKSVPKYHRSPTELVEFKASTVLIEFAALIALATTIALGFTFAAAIDGKPAVIEAAYAER